MLVSESQVVGLSGKTEEDKLSEEFAKNVKDNLINGGLSKTVLKTDQKVLARITDGIYRQPTSALRELICNSYDADATNVIIDTDFPRFNKISVKDNGNGMSIDALSNLLHHIGGSAKRDYRYVGLGVTDKSNPDLSPVLQRRLIGKIGIGLFSVAQLTRNFKIITKQEGKDFYLIADIRLHNFSDKQIQEFEKRGESFETGSVSVYAKKTDNIDAHGTDVILTNIKSSAIDQLKSIDIWHQFIIESEDNIHVEPDDPPKFHIGVVDINNTDLLSVKSILPWSEGELPEEKYKSLYSQLRKLEKSHKHPSIEKDFDAYLRMLWVLGLSLPVSYIDKHPFHMGSKDEVKLYQISNKDTSAKELCLDGEELVSDKLGLIAADKDSSFDVYIDGVKIYRPIMPVEDYVTSSALKKTLLFYGKVIPDLRKVKAQSSGGDLSFEGYIKWAPRIVPKEHRGVLVRVQDATGILFDETFMKFQLAEHLIKQQLTVEIFILEGFESALNIDRESFNISHPHYQILMRWLHHALKQAIRTIKNLQKNERTKVLDDRVRRRTQGYSELVRDIVKTKGGVESVITDVVITDDDRDETEVFEYVLSRNEFNEALREKTISKERMFKIEGEFKSLISVLDSYSLLDEMDEIKRKSLFQDIIKIISYEE